MFVKRDWMGNVYKNEINNAVNEKYHVNQWLWSIFQMLRGFKLICKHYFMHKVKKKASIIVQTNQPNSWVKSTLYDGLNK